MEPLTIFAALKTIGEIFKLTSTIKGAEVFQQHIELLRDQLALIGEAQAKAETENAELKKRVAGLEDELAKDWLQYRGALFKRLPSGKIDNAVYCPKCRVGAHPEALRFYTCARRECGWKSSITLAQTDAVLGEVAAEYGS